MFGLTWVKKSQNFKNSRRREREEGLQVKRHKLVSRQIRAGVKVGSKKKKGSQKVGDPSTGQKKKKEDQKGK